jgi:hypothetical protein
MAGFGGSASKLKRLDLLQKFRERMEREPMKTLAQRLQQILDKITRAFPSPLFPVPAPVRVVNRPQKHSAIRRRP